MAITYGMSVKEFWEENPDLFWAYRFSYYEKIKVEQEIFNNNAWLQGAYFHEAISVSLCNAFSKTKVTYSKQPYGFKETKEATEEQKKQQLEIDVADIKARIVQVNKIRSSTYKKGNPKKVGEKNE